MAAGKKKSNAVVAVDSASTALVGEETAGRFISQWNRLVSTTNWEKGRIICEWREALVAADAGVTEYSDEAWSQLVGRVTSQHVGRLRRVYQRFGAVFDQYEGLYWSHFQAAIDWEDAEMWLEGAIHNGWSVSQMRGKRWETVGKPGEAMPSDEIDAAVADEDEDVPWLGDESDMAAREAAFDGEEAASPLTSETAQRARSETTDDEEGGADRQAELPAGESSSSHDEAIKSSKKTRSRLNVDVGDLPDDVADAFEQFKLAIIAQRRLGWAETTPEAIIECLDALRELALAPADD